MDRTSQQLDSVCRVLIIDGHPAAREGLISCINEEPSISIFAEAGSIQEALTLLHPPLPELVVVEVFLPDGSGIDFVSRISSCFPQLSVVVWSMHSDELYAEEAIRAGALGYVNKRLSTTKVVEAIKMVLRGELYLSEAASMKMLHRSLGSPKESMRSSPVKSLSKRELQVFVLIGQGITTSKIAATLTISVHTVETHRQRIKNKLYLNNGSELTNQACRWVHRSEGG